MIAVPRRVFVFSGHLVDEPDRPAPRLPNDADVLARAGRALAAVLDAFGAGTADLALTQGACGGDLLFSAACLNRHVALRWLQPFAEADFIATSVACGGERWQPLYASLRAGLDGPPQAMPAVLGAPVDASDNPFRRCNQWLLDTARAYGIDKLQFICLWDRAAGDNAGGTAAMLAAAVRLTANITIVDSLAA